jgi:hypothetical protein
MLTRLSYFIRIDIIYKYDSKYVKIKIIQNVYLMNKIAFLHNLQ